MGNLQKFKRVAPEERMLELAYEILKQNEDVLCMNKTLINKFFNSIQHFNNVSEEEIRVDE